MLSAGNKTNTTRQRTTHMAKKSYNAGENNPRYKDGRYHAKKMTIRLPDEVDEKLTRLATAANVSKNELIVRLITAVKDGE
jgi:predicted HicB family RNase H-like nuclease